MVFFTEIYGFDLINRSNKNDVIETDWELIFNQR